VPTRVVQPTPTTTAVSVTPTSTPVSAISTRVAATPSGVKLAIPVPIYPPGDNNLTLALVLGVAAPSVLISGGGLWLLVKWLINRHREANSTANNSLRPVQKWP
jgi:hypothetical protein